MSAGEVPTSRRAQEGLVMIDDDLGTSGSGAFPALDQSQVIKVMLQLCKLSEGALTA